MATDEIITRYKIELDQLKAEVSQIVAQYGKVDDAADKSAKKTKKAFTDSAKAGKQYETALSGIATGIVAAFGVRQVLNYANSTIKAFADAEKSSEKLKFSVISLGKEGQLALKKLETQAQSLSAGGGFSFFDDDDIKRSQSMLVQFGLTSAQVEKLTPGILDLAVALDQDLGTATTTVLTALTGTTRGLKKIGGDFEDTKSVIGNYNKTLEVLTKVQGSATDALKTTSGALLEFDNVSGDVDETIGKKLAPALINLRSLGLDLKLAFASAVESLNKLLFSGAEEKLVKLGNESSKALEEAFKATLQYVDTDELEKRLDTVARLFKEQEADAQRFRKDKNQIAYTGAKQRQEEYQAERDAIRGILAERQAGLGGFQKILDDTSKLNKKELQSYIEGLQKRTDVGNATVQDAIEQAKVRIGEIEKLEQKALDDATSRREDALKKLQDLERSYAEQRKESIAKDEIEIIEIRKQSAKQQAKDLLILSGANNPAAIASFQKTISDIEIVFGKLTAEKKAEIAKASAEELEKIFEDLTKENERLVNIDYANFKKAQDDKAKAAEEAAERIKQAQQDAVDNSIQLVGTLMDIEQNLRSQRIVDLESQREQERTYADDQQVALQEQLNNRLITQGQYETESAKLKEKRLISEKEIQKKINAEKKKADEADKVRALFEIAINTATAIVKTGAQLGYPAAIPFVALIAALGLAQSAAVATRPLPKYAEGTRYLERGANKRGKDTIAIMADEGERIIPRKQNVKHWKLYNSIDDGSFDKLIHESYVLPALVAAQKNSQRHKQESFAENLAKSFITNATSKGTELYDLQRMWKSGIKVTNLQDLMNNDIKSPYR